MSVPATSAWSGHVAGQTMLMVVLASLVLGAIGYFTAPALLRLMGVAPDVYAGALGFMRVSFIGLVFNFTFFVFNAIMRSLGRATLPVYIVAGTVLLNFGLDPLLIFGWGPVPAYGVMGAAIATLVTPGHRRDHRHRHPASRACMACTCGAPTSCPTSHYVKRAFFLGFPASIEMSARALALMMMTFLITSFGTSDARRLRRRLQRRQVIIIPAMGLSMAISTLVGQNIGAGNIERAARIGRLGGLLGFVSLSVLGLLVFLFPASIVAFFVPDDPAVIAAGAEYLRIVAPAWGFLGLQFALTGVLRASGNMVMTMVLTAGLAMGAAVPAGLCAVQAHRAGRPGHLVGVPDRQRGDHADHDLCLRQGRLEEEAPARRGGSADRQGHRRDPDRRSPAVVSPPARSRQTRYTGDHVQSRSRSDP